MKYLKEKNGITLISLVITIVVLLILAGVSIATLTGENGILKKAIEAKENTETAKEEECVKMAVSEAITNEIRIIETENLIKALQNQGITIITSGDSINFSGDGPWKYQGKRNVYKIEKNGELLIGKGKFATNESYVGYYADINGDGNVDGIIYADLLEGGTGQWNVTPYDISKIDVSKDYYISNDSYSSYFGERKVVTQIGTGNDRFYVMSLKNELGLCYWYYQLYGKNRSLGTNTRFGYGKTNTKKIIQAYNNSTYAEQNDNDIWKKIQEKNYGNKSKIDEGWFVPSICEWAAFCDKIKVYRGNSYGLNGIYFSSSQTTGFPNSAFTINFPENASGGQDINKYMSIRLSIIF